MTEPRTPLSPIGVWGGFIDAVSELGDFVKDPAPSNPVGGAIHGRMRAQCDQFSRGEGRWKFMGPASIYAMEQHCTPYLEDQGSGPPELTEPDEPWKSYEGQDLTPYCGVRLRVFSYNFGAFSTVDVIEYSERVDPNNPANHVLDITYCNGNTGILNYIRSLNENKVSNITIQSTGVCPGCSGGDPLPPPEPVIGPNPNPRPDPGLDEDDEPTEDPTGQPVLPMPDLPNPWGDPIPLPSIPLPVFGGPRYEPSSDPSPDPGEPGDPVAIPEGGEAEETAEEGQELVGIQLEFTTVPGNPRQPGNVIGPQLYIGGAYVFMGIDGQGLELQSEGRVIESGQFFFAERPADKWRVIAALGYAVRVTPYYREVQK